jgi:hypothetical protein
MQIGIRPPFAFCLLPWRPFVDFERWLHITSSSRSMNLVARGADREEAWHRVRRNFGGVQQAKEDCRDARGMAASSNARCRPHPVFAPQRSSTRCH